MFALRPDRVNRAEFLLRSPPPARPALREPAGFCAGTGARANVGTFVGTLDQNGGKFRAIPLATELDGMVEKLDNEEVRALTSNPAQTCLLAVNRRVVGSSPT